MGASPGQAEGAGTRTGREKPELPCGPDHCERRGESRDGQGAPPGPHAGLTFCQPIGTPGPELPAEESPLGSSGPALVSLSCSAVGRGGSD